MQITNEASNLAAGIGLVVVNFAHDAEAQIIEGQIKAGSGLEVSAISRSVDSSAVAKAGHVPPSVKNMVAGAIAVHVTSIRSTARLNNSAKYYLGENADINVLSMCWTAAWRPWATPAASGCAKILRVLPLKMNVPIPATAWVWAPALPWVSTGIDVIAEIQDGISFKDLSGTQPAAISLDGITVSAYYTGGERVFAAAGSEAGISATPVSATGVSGVYVYSNLGQSDQGIQAKGNVTVSAQNKMSRYLTADAAAAGDQGGHRRLRGRLRHQRLRRSLSQAQGEIRRQRECGGGIRQPYKPQCEGCRQRRRDQD